jgi:hypothetical protein
VFQTAKRSAPSSCIRIVGCEPAFLGERMGLNERSRAPSNREDPHPRSRAERALRGRARHEAEELERYVQPDPGVPGRLFVAILAVARVRGGEERAQGVRYLRMREM